MDISFLNKWLHLLSVIGMLGGVAFAWLVLVPALQSGGEETEMEKTLWRRFGISLAVFWLIVLLTGFYNYYLISTSTTLIVTGTYHMYVGMKMVLAILMFLLSLGLAHPLPALERMRRHRASWLLVILALGIVVVGISARLNIGRVNRSLVKPETPAAAPGR